MVLDAVLFPRLDMSCVLIKSRIIRRVVKCSCSLASKYNIRHNSSSLLPLLPFILLSLHSSINLNMVLSLFTSFLLVLFCTRGHSRNALWEASDVLGRENPENFCKSGNPRRVSYTCIRFNTYEAGGYLRMNYCDSLLEQEHVSWCSCEECPRHVQLGEVLIVEVHYEEQLYCWMLPWNEPSFFHPFPPSLFCPAFWLQFFLGRARGVGGERTFWVAELESRVDKTREFIISLWKHVIICSLRSHTALGKTFNSFNEWLLCALFFSLLNLGYPLWTSAPFFHTCLPNESEGPGFESFSDIRLHVISQELSFTS